MLNIDWVFNDSSTPGESGGFGDFINALAKAPHEHVFATEFIVNIVEHFFPVYFYQVLRKVTLPYLIYWIATVFYFSQEILTEMDPDKLWDMSTSEFWTR